MLVIAKAIILEKGLVKVFNAKAVLIEKWLVNTC